MKEKRVNPRIREPSPMALFLVFEGIDGSGKTSMSSLVARGLRERGISVEHLRPGLRPPLTLADKT